MKKTQKIVLAAFAATALLAATGAQARDDHRRGHGYHGHHGHHGHYVRHLPPRVFYRPAPVYYAPAPVYYPPQPVYYVPPRPVIYGTLPVGDARVRIGVQF